MKRIERRFGDSAGVRGAGSRIRGLAAWLPLLVLLLVFLAACMQTVRRGGGPDLVFSHRFHIEEAGAECGTCHEAATESASGADRLLPDMAACMQCHDEEDDCRRCHPGAPEEARPVPRPAEGLNFSHAAHLGRDLSCDDCHEGIWDSVNVLDRSLPAMETCLRCHDGRQAPAECSVCHEDLRSSGLIPRNHGADWLWDHRMEARANDATCLSCHEESRCDACHQGRVDRAVHDRNFRYTHSLAARGNPRQCGVCHGTAFCQSCHAVQ
jgi:c(7)-type cytochrome triheme protein